MVNFKSGHAVLTFYRLCARKFLVFKADFHPLEVSERTQFCKLNAGHVQHSVQITSETFSNVNNRCPFCMEELPEWRSTFTNMPRKNLIQSHRGNLPLKIYVGRNILAQKEETFCYCSITPGNTF